MPLATLNQIINPSLPNALNAIVAGEFGALATFGQSIIIRRGDTTLAAQDVRIVTRSGRATIKDSIGTEQSELFVLVTGDVSLDIAAGDRFNDSEGNGYRVTFVQPNRQIQTVAHAKVVQ